MADLEAKSSNAENLVPANATNAAAILGENATNAVNFVNVPNSANTNSAVANANRPVANANKPLANANRPLVNANRPMVNANRPMVNSEVAVQEPTTSVPIKADLSDYLNTVPPYDDATAKQIKNFYKKREKNQTSYTYTDDGNLVIFSKSGAEESRITLKSYVNHDNVIRDEREQARLDAIGEGESQYEAALKKLREAHAAYKISGSMQPLLAAQKAMAEADQILTRVRYGSRDIVSVPNPEVRDILFDQPYEARKLISEGKDPFGKELARLIVLEYPYNNFYGSYVESEEVEPLGDADASMDKAPEASEANVRHLMKNGKYGRVFFEADESANGFLSPFWPSEFTLDDVKYFTGLQAYEVLRAEQGGNMELKKQLLGTRSTRTMRFLTKKLEFQPKSPKDVWLRIFTAIYQQHPILKDKLLKTGTDTLIFADIRKGPSGTGLGERDAGILTESRWLYENAVGKALEALRYQLRENTAAESAVNAKPTEAVISTDEQAAAKTGAIIGARKKFMFKR
jgi:predicted NAD-dependent protein-ADP-ribosyltransferase YbiA (DUF1768 family)